MTVCTQESKRKPPCSKGGIIARIGACNRTCIPARVDAAVNCSRIAERAVTNWSIRRRTIKPLRDVHATAIDSSILRGQTIIVPTASQAQRHERRGHPRHLKRSDFTHFAPDCRPDWAKHKPICYPALRLGFTQALKTVQQQVETKLEFQCVD